MTFDRIGTDMINSSHNVKIGVHCFRYLAKQIDTRTMSVLHTQLVPGMMNRNEELETNYELNVFIKRNVADRHIILSGLFVRISSCNQDICDFLLTLNWQHVKNLSKLHRQFIISELLRMKGIQVCNIEVLSTDSTNAVHNLQKLHLYGTLLGRRHWSRRRFHSYVFSKCQNRNNMQQSVNPLVLSTVSTLGDKQDPFFSTEKENFNNENTFQSSSEHSVATEKESVMQLAGEVLLRAMPSQKDIDAAKFYSERIVSTGYSSVDPVHYARPSLMHDNTLVMAVQRVSASFRVGRKRRKKIRKRNASRGSYWCQEEIVIDDVEDMEPDKVQIVAGLSTNCVSEKQCTAAVIYID